MQNKNRLAFKTLIAENVRLLRTMLTVALRPRENLDQSRYRIARDVLSHATPVDTTRQNVINTVLSDTLDVYSAEATAVDLTRPPVELDDARYAYQKANIRHKFQPDDKVLDIGSGSDPFPLATVLADRFIEPTHHRTTYFKTDNKPSVICDVSDMPFESGAFDYIVCAHVLEHVDDPIRACREIQRVGKAGFIETPTLMKDALFSWAKGMHRWHVVAQNNHLIFFEYDDRRADGVRDLTWNNLILNRRSFHPLQQVFVNNQDLFNTMLEWHGHFDVTVFYEDGGIKTTFQNIEVIAEK